MTQYREVNGTKSNMLRSTFGAAQGSVLGSLLYIIYVNDFYNRVVFT